MNPTSRTQIAALELLNITLLMFNTILTNITGVGLSLSHGNHRVLSCLTGCKKGFPVPSSLVTLVPCASMNKKKKTKNKYPFQKASKGVVKAESDGGSAEVSPSPGNLPQAPCGFNHCQSFSLMHFGRPGTTGVTALELPQPPTSAPHRKTRTTNMHSKSQAPLNIITIPWVIPQTLLFLCLRSLQMCSFE